MDQKKDGENTVHGQPQNHGLLKPLREMPADTRTFARPGEQPPKNRDMRRQDSPAIVKYPTPQSMPVNAVLPSNTGSAGEHAANTMATAARRRRTAAYLAPETQRGTGVQPVPVPPANGDRSIPASPNRRQTAKPAAGRPAQAAASPAPVVPSQRPGENAGSVPQPMPTPAAVSRPAEPVHRAAKKPARRQTGNAAYPQPPQPKPGPDGRIPYSAPAAGPNGQPAYAVPQAARPAAPDARQEPADRGSHKLWSIGGKRMKAIWIAVAALLAVLLIVYFSGVFGHDSGTVTPADTANAELPSVFVSATGTPGDTAATIAPAQAAPAAALLSASVSPAETEAPATLTFTLETNAVTAAVRLMDNRDRILHINTTSSAQGDGLLWKITLEMENAYTGTVRFFLRDQAGTWTEGNETCMVSVR